ncbi:hypothetical protein PLESTM_001333800 [Pleodorina starrii]|nr:hypothetical protein PLESTM_001333800 [Pleodorina starrii]
MGGCFSRLRILMPKRTRDPTGPLGMNTYPGPAPKHQSSRRAIHTQDIDALHPVGLPRAGSPLGAAARLSLEAGSLGAEDGGGGGAQLSGGPGLPEALKPHLASICLPVASGLTDASHFSTESSSEPPQVQGIMRVQAVPYHEQPTPSMHKQVRQQPQPRLPPEQQQQQQPQQQPHTVPARQPIHPAMAQQIPPPAPPPLLMQTRSFDNKQQGADHHVREMSSLAHQDPARPAAHAVAPDEHPASRQTHVQAPALQQQQQQQQEGSQELQWSAWEPSRTAYDSRECQNPAASAPPQDLPPPPAAAPLPPPPLPEQQEQQQQQQQPQQPLDPSQPPQSPRHPYTPAQPSPEPPQATQPPPPPPPPPPSSPATQRQPEPQQEPMRDEQPFDTTDPSPPLSSPPQQELQRTCSAAEAPRSHELPDVSPSPPVSVDSICSNGGGGGHLGNGGGGGYLSNGGNELDGASCLQGMGFDLRTCEPSGRGSATHSIAAGAAAAAAADAAAGGGTAAGPGLTPPPTQIASRSPEAPQTPGAALHPPSASAGPALLEGAGQQQQQQLPAGIPPGSRCPAAPPPDEAASRAARAVPLASSATVPIPTQPCQIAGVVFSGGERQPQLLPLTAALNWSEFSCLRDRLEWMLPAGSATGAELSRPSSSTQQQPQQQPAPVPPPPLTRLDGDHELSYGLTDAGLEGRGFGWAASATAASAREATPVMTHGSAAFGAEPQPQPHGSNGAPQPTPAPSAASLQLPEALCLGAAGAAAAACTASGVAGGDEEGSAGSGAGDEGFLRSESHDVAQGLSSETPSNALQKSRASPTLPPFGLPTPQPQPANGGYSRGDEPAAEPWAGQVGPGAAAVVDGPYVAPAQMQPPPTTPSAPAPLQQHQPQQEASAGLALPRAQQSGDGGEQRPVMVAPPACLPGHIAAAAMPAADGNGLGMGPTTSQPPQQQPQRQYELQQYHAHRQEEMIGQDHYYQQQQQQQQPQQPQQQPQQQQDLAPRPQLHAPASCGHMSRVSSGTQAEAKRTVWEACTTEFPDGVIGPAGPLGSCGHFDDLQDIANQQQQKQRTQQRQQRRKPGREAPEPQPYASDPAQPQHAPQTRPAVVQPRELRQQPRPQPPKVSREKRSLGAWFSSMIASILPGQAERPDSHKQPGLDNRQEHWRAHQDGYAHGQSLGDIQLRHVESGRSASATGLDDRGYMEVRPRSAVVGSRVAAPAPAAAPAQPLAGPSWDGGGAGGAPEAAVGGGPWVGDASAQAAATAAWAAVQEAKQRAAEAEAREARMWEAMCKAEERARRAEAEVEFYQHDKLQAMAMEEKAVSDLAALGEELQRVKSLLGAAERGNVDLRNQAARLDHGRRELQAQVRDLEVRLQAQAAQSKSYLRQLADARQEVEDLQMDKDRLQERCSELVHENDNLRLELDELLHHHHQHLAGQAGQAAVAPPPVLWLDASRLRIGADQEIGFGVSELNNHLYDFTKALENVVSGRLLPRLPPADPRPNILAHKAMLWLRRAVWDEPTGLLCGDGPAMALPPGRPDAPPSGQGATSVGPPPPSVAAGTDPWVTTGAVGAWRIVPLPLNPEEQNLQLLLRSHAARRWYDVVRAAIDDGGGGGGGGGGPVPVRLTGGGTSNEQTAGAAAVEVVRQAVEAVASGLADVLAEEAGLLELQLPAPPKVAALRSLASRALLLGLFAPASHPLLRLVVSPAVSVEVAAAAAAAAAAPAVGGGGGLPSGAHAPVDPVAFSPIRQENLKTVRLPQPPTLPPTPSTPPQPQQRPNNRGAAAAVVPLTDAGRGAGDRDRVQQLYVLFSTRPGAMYHGTDGTTVALKEEVVTWVGDAAAAAAAAAARTSAPGVATAPSEAARPAASAAIPGHKTATTAASPPAASAAPAGPAGQDVVAAADRSGPVGPVASAAPSSRASAGATAPPTAAINKPSGAATAIPGPSHGDVAVEAAAAAKAAAASTAAAPPRNNHTAAMPPTAAPQNTAAPPPPGAAVGKEAPTAGTAAAAASREQACSAAVQPSDKPRAETAPVAAQTSSWAAVAAGKPAAQPRGRPPSPQAPAAPPPTPGDSGPGFNTQPPQGAVLGGGNSPQGAAGPTAPPPLGANGTVCVARSTPGTRAGPGSCRAAVSEGTPGPQQASRGLPGLPVTPSPALLASSQRGSAAAAASEVAAPALQQQQGAVGSASGARQSPAPLESSGAKGKMGAPSPPPAGGAAGGRGNRPSGTQAWQRNGHGGNGRGGGGSGSDGSGSSGDGRRRGGDNGGGRARQVDPPMANAGGGGPAASGTLGAGGTVGAGGITYTAVAAAPAAGTASVRAKP